MPRPCVLVTAGDPAGIGYELAAALAGDRRSQDALFIADPVLWRAAASLARLRLTPMLFEERMVPALADHLVPSGSYGLIPVRCDRTKPIRPGRLNAASGRRALAALDAACRIIAAGSARRRYGLLTMPVSKEAIQRAGVHFPGHTEYLARRFNVRDVAMLMIGRGYRGERYRVLLLTRHVPLRAVSGHLRPEPCATQIRSTAAFLACHDPACRRGVSVLICGVNPHTGENGAIGTEETAVLRRLAHLLRAGAHSVGIRRVECPVLTEQAFARAAETPATLVVCTYHDQGMVPLKLLCGHVIANVTVGLPFIRVSPGHGTAADIAGTGTADRTPAFFALDVLGECLGTA